MTKFLCPLPWISVSIHTNGEQRVCCHSETPHVVEKNNSNPLNNTTLVKVREEMRKGQTPELCKSCFHYEERGLTSPRQEHLKNYAEIFARKREQSNDSLLPYKDIEFLDLSLGNLCNSTCLICHPYYSNRIADWAIHPNLSEELKKIENYSRGDGIKSINLVETLIFKSLYFQGGEPFISPLHEKILKKLIDDDRAKEIELNYSTNLSVLPQSLITLWSHFKCINLNISLDGTGEIQEYLRPPLKWKKFLKNLELVQNLNKCQVSFTTVIYALNLNSLAKTFQFALDQTNKPPQIIYLQTPSSLQIDSLSQKAIEIAYSNWKEFASKETRGTQIISDFFANQTGRKNTSPELLVFIRKLESQYKLSRPDSIQDCLL